MAGLRLEENVRVVAVTTQETSIEEWRRRSVQTADRLKKAEQKIAELTKTADELRARLSKEKTRLDEVSALADQKQVELVKVAAERDEMRAQVQDITTLKRKVWDALYS